MNSLIQPLNYGDSFIIIKLNRLAHSTAKGTELLIGLFNKRVSVHILNIVRIDNTPDDKLITNILIAFAEYERDMIIERT